MNDMQPWNSVPLILVCLNGGIIFLMRELTCGCSMAEIFQKKVNELKWLYVEKLMVEIQTGVRGGFLEIQ